MAIEPATREDPEWIYQRAWAVSVIELALDRLSEEQSRAGHARLFEKLRPALAGAASATAGSVDLLSAPFPSPPETVELRIGFAVGRVTGSVASLDCSAGFGSLVTLIPVESRRERSDLYFTTIATPNGAFAFENVPAGDYLLFAWEQIPPGAHQSPEFIRRFEGRGQSIRIEKGQTIEAQLNLIPAVN